MNIEAFGLINFGGDFTNQINTPDERISQISRDLKEKNVNFIFEDYYSSLIEIIHSIILIDGYKILNHICLGNYLKDVLKRDDLFRVFDDLRYKRNSITYYVKKMDFEVGKDAIEKCKKLIKELKNILNKKL